MKDDTQSLLGYRLMVFTVFFPFVLFVIITEAVADAVVSSAQGLKWVWEGMPYEHE